MGLFSKSNKKKKAPIPPIYTHAVSINETPDKEEISSYFSEIAHGTPELIIVVSSLNLDIEQIVSYVCGIFPKTHVIGIKVRGLIATEKSLVPKSGIGFLSFSRKHFRAAIWLPQTAKEHKITHGIPAAVKNFSKLVGNYSGKFPGIQNITLWDSYQNGHELINVYEKETNNLGLFNTAHTGVILHPDNNLKHVLITYGRGKELHKVTNGFIFVSLFSNLKIRNSISIGLHPLIPFKITEAKGNVVLKLNNKPAFLAYKNYIMKKGVSEGELMRDLPYIFSTYQFGFPNPRNPRKPEIRIALKRTEEDGILFNGDIPAGSTIWVMYADKTEMVHATSTLAENTLNGNIRGGFAFSSIFRLIRMKNDYMNDINNLKNALHGAPLLLFNTYLEIYYKNSREAYSNTSSNLVNIFHE